MKKDLFPFRGVRRRKWVSYVSYGCLYDSIVMVVYRAPVINNIIQYHLAWQHKIVST
jgi:hypothetical protein